MPEFAYSPLFPMGEDKTTYRKLDLAGVSTSQCGGKTVLHVTPESLTELTAQAFHEVAHFLRPAHLTQLASILKDPEASDNDRFVALDLLKNACIAAGGVLPMCQDTGTAIVFGKKVSVSGWKGTRKLPSPRACTKPIHAPICAIPKWRR